MSAPGDKAKLVNLFDNSLAIEAGLESVYKIEVFFTRSPGGVKCGAISIFKNNSIDLAANPLLTDAKKLQEMQDELSKQTEVMYQDPIKFRADRGQWIEWAMSEALRFYDKFGGATIVVKAPRLKIRERRSSGSVASGRSDMRNLFKSLRDIDRLLSKDFKWDAWSGTIRRGEVNKDKGKR
jgi:hypothetical protein